MKQGRRGKGALPGVLEQKDACLPVGFGRYVISVTFELLYVKKAASVMNLGVLLSFRAEIMQSSFEVSWQTDLLALHTDNP